MYSLLYDTDIRKQSCKFKNRKYIVYRYSRQDDPMVMQLYKEVVNDMYCFVLVVNGTLIKNFAGNTVMWTTIQEAQQDIIDIFKGKFPTRCIGIRDIKKEAEEQC